MPITCFQGLGFMPGATPSIYKNLAIISPTTGEQGRYGIAGDPRAFDLQTGKEVWRIKMSNVASGATMTMPVMAAFHIPDAR